MCVCTRRGEELNNRGGRRAVCVEGGGSVGVCMMRGEELKKIRGKRVEGVCVGDRV